MTLRLALEDVSAGYGERAVLADFSLELEAGEVVALVGPNGAGKSTALRVAAGLLATKSGSVLLEGRPIGGWKRAELARRLAIVLQLQATPALMKVAQYVSLGRTPYVPFFGSETGHDWLIVAQAMDLADAGGLADRRLDELSGGERQRVSIARALAQEPSVLLLDEPTSNLDLKYQETVLSLTRKLARDQGLACLVVLHDVTLAGQFADRVCLLSMGRLVAEGAPAEVLTEDRLSAIYDTSLAVLPHPQTGRPVVVHAARTS